MADPIITDINNGAVELEGGRFQRNKVLTFAGADTFVAGTILASQEVATAITVTPGVGNTGNGTVTASVTGVEEVPAVGAYVLECTFAVTNGGVFKVTGPKGDIVADNLTLRVGAGLVTNFVVDGITFVVTDDTTDFAAGDTFSAAVVANDKFVPFATDGVAGAGVPKAVLTYDVTATGAGDVAIDALIAGDVRFDKLVIDADGDNTNVDQSVRDQLRNFGINVLDSRDLSDLDNS